MSEITLELHDLKSTVRGEGVPTAVVLPPGYEDQKEPLPLLISLHGGGASRDHIVEFAPFFQTMFDQQILPPLAIVGFSSGPGSWYAGSWERFVVEELPTWLHERYGTRLDRDGTVMTGISMGGYGTLKIAFKNPARFRAIASMEAAIEPSFTREPNFRRNTWYRMPFMEAAAWGDPLDEAAWLAYNPATVLRENAAPVRESGLDIYLEVGDRDYINLHDGTEFIHRVLWDHDIPHEYHLVRWADHVGLSMERRLFEAYGFLGAALAGGRSEPVDLPLAPEEQAHVDWIANGMPGAPSEYSLTADPVRAPSVHARLWKALRATAEKDPALARNYAELPPSK